MWLLQLYLINVYDQDWKSAARNQSQLFLRDKVRTQVLKLQGWKRQTLRTSTTTSPRYKNSCSEPRPRPHGSPILFESYFFKLLFGVFAYITLTFKHWNVVIFLLKKVNKFHFLINKPPCYVNHEGCQDLQPRLQQSEEWDNDKVPCCTLLVH